jgi:hypothetical protein
MKESKKESKVLRIVFIVIIVLSLGMMIGVMSYTINKNSQLNSKVIAYRVINTSVEVKLGVMGLNGDKDALRFGRVAPGNGGSRFINISTKEKALVNIYITGEMAKFLIVDKNSFVMEPGTSLSVPFNIYIPDNATVGNYTGKVTIELLRP